MAVLCCVCRLCSLKQVHVHASRLAACREPGLNRVNRCQDFDGAHGISAPVAPCFDSSALLVLRSANSSRASFPTSFFSSICYSEVFVATKNAEIVSPGKCIGTAASHRGSMDGAILTVLHDIQQQVVTLAQEHAILREQVTTLVHSLTPVIAARQQSAGLHEITGGARTIPEPAQGLGNAVAEGMAAVAAPPPHPQALPVAEEAAAGPADNEQGEPFAPGNDGCEPLDRPPATAEERPHSMQRDPAAAAAACPMASGQPAVPSPGATRRRQAPALVRPGRRLVPQSIGAPAASTAARGVTLAAHAAAAQHQGGADEGHTFADHWVGHPSRPTWYENFSVVALPAVAPGGRRRRCVWWFAMACWCARLAGASSLAAPPIRAVLLR